MDSIRAGKIFAPAAREALAQFAIGPAEMRFTHVSENVTFRVTEHGSGRSFVLRLHRPSYHSLDALKAEHMWTGALAAAGIGVPAPFAARNGEHYVEAPVAALREKRWVSLSGWIEGKLLAQVMAGESDGRAAASHFASLGTLLARAHQQAVEWHPPAAFTRHRLDADGLMGDTPFWGPFWQFRHLSPAESRLLLNTRDTIRGALQRYGTPPHMFSMIHADAHPDNVIVAEDGLTLIDFDDAAFGWHQFDLAVALIWYLPRPDFAQLRDSCIAAYRAVRPLSDDDLALLPMFLLARGMAQLGWFQQRPELTEPPEVADLKQWICDTAADFRPPC